MIFDSYSINGIFDKLIYKIAWIIVIMSIILAILFIAIPFKEIIIYKG
jgi:hypothetical protein